jgi:hypothetical protein
MKKRQLKKLARRAVEQCKGMEAATPIQPAKIRNALWLYIRKNQNDYKEPKITREFWKWFEGLWK